MRKLLLSISIVIFIVSFLGCERKQPNKSTDSNIQTNVTSDSTNNVKDTLFIDSGEKKSTIIYSDTINKHEAPKHNGPNQTEIDSIKKAKEKQKFK